MTETQALIDFILYNIPPGVIVKICDEAERQARYKCPRCNDVVGRGDNPCPHCRAPLRWF